MNKLKLLLRKSFSFGILVCVMYGFLTITYQNDIWAFPWCGSYCYDKPCHTTTVLIKEYLTGDPEDGCAEAYEGSCATCLERSLEQTSLCNDTNIYPCGN